MLILILLLSAFTHLWNPVGFPDLFSDEGVYVRRAIEVLAGLGPQESSRYYDHPFFGQLFLASIFKVIGYPDSLHTSQTHSIEMLYLVPRLLMGFLAVIDTFLIYLISKYHYNKKVALIACILFSVMPISWFTRRILLEPIQLTFFLSSTLFAVYTRTEAYKRRTFNENQIKQITDSNKNNDNKIKYSNKITLVLLSGIFLGLSIFTKIPMFVTIPFVGYLIFTNTNRSWKTLGFWFVPVILIPLIWPAYSVAVGHYNDWQRTVIGQMHREGLPLLQRISQLIVIEPVLLFIGIAGLVLSGLKKDLFILLWTIPILLFIFLIDWLWAPYHVFIPLIPPFCILAALFIVKITDLISDRNIQRFLLWTVISAICIFGLVSTTILISRNVTSTQFQTIRFVSQYLGS